MANLLLRLIAYLFLLSYFPIKTRRYQTVEHIVLFKVKPNIEQTNIDAMVAELNDLKNMEGVDILYLSSGPVYRVQSSTLNFTHFLHSRYGEPEDLEIFMANPQHLKLVHDYTDPLTDDYMIVNWVVHTEEELVNPAPGSAMRIMFLKLKEVVADRMIGEVLDIIREGGLERKAVQFTCGENYDNAAKGYHIGSLMVFNGMKDLDEGGSIEEFAKRVEETVKDFVESVFVVDYIVSSRIFSGWGFGHHATSCPHCGVPPLEAIKALGKALRSSKEEDRGNRPWLIVPVGCARGICLRASPMGVSIGKTLKTSQTIRVLYA